MPHELGSIALGVFLSSDLGSLEEPSTAHDPEFRLIRPAAWTNRPETLLPVPLAASGSAGLTLALAGVRDPTLLLASSLPGSELRVGVRVSSLLWGRADDRTFEHWSPSRQRAHSSRSGQGAWYA